MTRFYNFFCVYMRYYSVPENTIVKFTYKYNKLIPFSTWLKKPYSKESNYRSFFISFDPRWVFFVTAALRNLWLSLEAETNMRLHYENGPDLSLTELEELSLSDLSRWNPEDFLSNKPGNRRGDLAISIANLERKATILLFVGSLKVYRV